MKKIKLVEVIWEDAWSAAQISGDPDEVTELMPPLYRQTVGYLVAKDSEKVILSRDLDPKFLGRTDSFSDCTRIPRVLVRKITELSPRVPAPRKPRRRKPPAQELNSLNCYPCCKIPIGGGHASWCKEGIIT